MQTRFAARLLAGAALAALDLAPGAPAPAQELEPETVVVTGARGAERTAIDSPVPIDVFGAEDLRTTGAFAGELGVALQTVTPSFNFERQSNSGSADLVRPAQLRGLSPDQVLVLVNGKRRHTTSITTTEAKVGRGTAPVDFNSIPLSAVSRIEVLRDGAGAQYGSDAIAGVIDVILDERPDAIEASASYGSHITDFEPTADHWLADGGTWTAAGSFGLPLAGDGFFRAGIDWAHRQDTNRAGFDPVPSFEDPANIPLVGGRRNYKPGDGDFENLNFWVNGAAAIDRNIRGYWFGTYNTRDVEGTGFFRYPIGTQNILSVYPLGYRPVTTGQNEDWQAVAGARGDWRGFDWDASVDYGRNDLDLGVRNSLNPSLGPDSPRAFRSGKTENRLTSLNLDVTRGLDLGLEAPATLALGAEYRNEHFRSKAGDPASYEAGPFAADGLAIGAQAGTGLRPEETRDLDRDVWSLYGELSADVTRRLFADVAARFEDYEDFGEAWAGKVAARWEFTDGFALRAAVSNSFRAPSLVQLGFGTSSTSFGEGGRLSTVNTLQVDDPVARALGARDLDPERSLNTSVGFTGEFYDGLTATIDLFRIGVDDRITLSERIDCAPPLAAAPLCEARSITAANFFTNAINTSTQGFEIVLAYDQPVYDGRVALSAAWTSLDTDVDRVHAPSVPEVVVFGVEERNTIEGAAPESRGVFTARWENDAVSLLGRLTRHGKTTRVFNFGEGFQPSQTYSAEWQVDVEGGLTVMDGVQLFLGATNLLDEYPDLSIPDISFSGNLPYDVLSPLGFNGRFVYGGVRATF